MTTGFPQVPDLVTVAFDPSDATVAYAGGYEGLFRSTDAGASWSPADGLPTGGDVEPVGIAIAPSDSRVIYFGDASGVIYRSQDAGETWSITDQIFGWGNETSIAVNPSVPTTLYAGTRYGPQGVVKSVDAGRSWQTLNDGLIDTSMEWVVADPSRPNVVYAGTLDGTIRKSTDGGADWNDLVLQATALGIDPSNPDVFYAGSWTRLADGSFHIGSVSRSDDGGLHWTYLQRLRRGSRTHPITSLIVSTKNPETI